MNKKTYTRCGRCGGKGMHRTEESSKAASKVVFHNMKIQKGLSDGTIEPPKDPLEYDNLFKCEPEVIWQVCDECKDSDIRGYVPRNNDA
jgi:hypothetical protein